MRVGMNRLLPLLLVSAALLAAGAAAASAASSAHPRQTRQQAERNLLHATRMLRRWHVNLVDTKTGLLRQNTTASCRGVGRPVRAHYASFRCVLRHGSRHVLVRYLALRRNGFEAHRL
jgi:hypothetical protein